MNVEKIVSELKSLYPNKDILQIPSQDPKEIIVEVEPTSINPNYSLAVAVIEESYPHVHHRSFETYRVLRGEVHLFLGPVRKVLHEGDIQVIEPGTVHWAIADSAMVECASEPGWIPEDHILVHDAREIFRHQ